MKSIRIEHLSKTYTRGRTSTEVLKDLNFTIEAGEFFFLLGPSGCGKTTLLRIIAGMLEPTLGRVYLDDEDVTDRPVDKRGCAMVFQNYALWPHMTVQQNVEFGPLMQKKQTGERQQTAREQLERVQMEDYGKRKPNQLSGGQQQRVALARALAAEPSYLLLDEPLSNLDARLRMLMRTELRQLVKTTKTTAIYVTHDQKEALSMADRIAIMHGGDIIQIGSPVEVYNRPNTRFVADFVGEANFLPGRVERTEGQGVIETAVGNMLTNDERAGERNNQVLCCVRPERLKLLRDEETVEGLNVLEATVRRVVNLGEICQYFLTLEEGTSWKVTALSQRYLPAGEDQRVRVGVSPDDVIVLPDGH